MAMDVRTCRGCRRIFNYVSGPMLCPACKQALEAWRADVSSDKEPESSDNIQSLLALAEQVGV